MVQRGNAPWRRLAAGVVLMMLGAVLAGSGVGSIGSTVSAQGDASGLRDVGVIADPDEALTDALADCTAVAS